ncbi:hypothetical protein [Synechococcus sp. CS-1328]|uniref:hypothetical protein n=1 Tax=Synechococcus sp. CS-1328 TaxID=2847976 RepID=UPI00223B063D|nr:hypothetical protein [Synechococcus sp. CS-1328]MCT0224595.1 hypothetical protein [Synechococcus sp. CS-1328]
MNAVVAVIPVPLIPVALIAIATVSTAATAAAAIGACSSAIDLIPPAEVGNAAVGFADRQLGCISFPLQFHR